MDELPLPQGAPMPNREDEVHMQAAVARVHGLIQAEIDKGIDANRIVLAGFSQGAFSAGPSTRTEHMMLILGSCPHRLRNYPACRSVDQGEARRTHVSVGLAANGLQDPEVSLTGDPPGTVSG